MRIVQEGIEGIRQTRKRNVVEGVSVDGIRDRQVLIVRLPIRMINTRSYPNDGISMRPGNADSWIDIVKPRTEVRVCIWAEPAARGEVERNRLVVERVERIENVVANTGINCEIRSYLPFVLRIEPVFVFPLPYQRENRCVRRLASLITQKIRRRGVGQRSAAGGPLIQKDSLEFKAELKSVVALRPRHVVQEADRFRWVVRRGSAAKGAEAGYAERIGRGRESRSVIKVLVDSELELVDQPGREHVEHFENAIVELRVVEGFRDQLAGRDCLNGFVRIEPNKRCRPVGMVVIEPDHSGVFVVDLAAEATIVPDVRLRRR